MIYMFLSNKPSSGDINSSNLSCFSMKEVPHNDLPLNEGHFYVRSIWLYLYKYRIRGTIGMHILKGLASVYQLI